MAEVGTAGELGKRVAEAGMPFAGGFDMAQVAGMQLSEVAEFQ